MPDNRLNLVAAAAALAFFAGAVGYVIGTTEQRPPSEIDVGFLQDMIVHHDQAVAMSLIAREQTDDGTIRTFANEVILIQRREIGLMESLLHRWGQERDTGEVVMDWMGMEMPLEEMPGYANEIEMDTLRATEGPEFDSLFLTMLATHHVGGIQMAAFAADEAQGDDTRELAGIIARNQALELPEYAFTAERLGLPGVPDAPTLAELARLGEVAQQ